MKNKSVRRPNFFATKAFQHYSDREMSSPQLLSARELKIVQETVVSPESTLKHYVKGTPYFPSNNSLRD